MTYFDEIYNKIKSRCHKVTIKDSKYCLCVSNSQVQQSLYMFCFHFIIMLIRAFTYNLNQIYNAR